MGLPPTRTKGNGDATPVVTFEIDAPNIPITHSGVVATIGTIPIAGGGTGQTAQTAAFDALAPTTTKADIIVNNGTNNVRQGVGADGTALIADSAQTTGIKWGAVLTNPMSAAGQMIYGGTAGAPTAVAAGTSGQYLKSTGTTAPVWTDFKAPTVSLASISSFSGGFNGVSTYTPPVGTKYIVVEMVGGGGGGAGSATTAAGNHGSGSAGGNTTFGTSLLVANGGGGGGGSGSGAAGAGGTASLGTGPVGVALTGASGSGSNTTIAGQAVIGAAGGSTPFGGAGGSNAAGPATGIAAINGTGSGGGAASAGASSFTGGSGGAAGYVKAMITSLLSSYSYALGAGGTAGTAGTGGSAGGAGGAGIIIVTEYYQ